jgi:hypothetical protein
MQALNAVISEWRLSPQRSVQELQYRPGERRRCRYVTDQMVFLAPSGFVPDSKLDTVVAFALHDIADMPNIQYGETRRGTDFPLGAKHTAHLGHFGITIRKSQRFKTVD